MKLRTLILVVISTTAASVFGSVALADPPEQVGRISYTEGDVSFQPPQEEEWTEATVNYPVTEGESFWTGETGRAELQIGSVEARLDNETEVDVAELQYGDMRLALPQGSVSLRVRGAPRGGVTVSTPAGDVRIEQRGFYRIDVGAPQDDGSYPPVEVTVFAGIADAPGPEGFTSVHPRESAVLYAGSDPELQVAEDTAIDDWSRARARLESQRTNYALPEAMTGGGDLGRYGQFVSDPDYGTVWFPRDVPADWAPYRYGHWAYVAPWGYTWIDEQPWGFAPFHYGRWAFVNGRWGWIPGQLAPEPTYSPALVAFIGGPDWNLGPDVGGEAGVEAMGWVPLGPEEVYRPPYAVSDTYLRRLNVGAANTTTINTITASRMTSNVPINTYRNARAATVVRAEAFRRGVTVQRAVVPVSAEALARAPIARPVVRIAPTARAGAGNARRLDAFPTERAAAPPPARLRAVRAAVVARAVGTNKPPVIAGARLAAPRPKGVGGRAKVLIAPAQVKNPAAQGRQPVEPFETQTPTPPTPGAAVQAPRTLRRPDASTTIVKPDVAAPVANAASQVDSQARAARRAKAKAAQEAKTGAVDAADSATSSPTKADQPAHVTPPPIGSRSVQGRALAAARAKAKREQEEKMRDADASNMAPPQ